MSNEIKCLVCKGKYFRKAYYDLNVKVDIDSYIKSSDEEAYVYNDISTRSDIDFKLESDEKENGWGRADDYSDIYKYSCEDCGFIMSFTQEKQIESRNKEKKRKEKERTYDWSNFK